MNATLISNWNAVVKPDDEVWNLGDVCINPKKVKDFVPLLNGRHILIMGNHDGNLNDRKKDGFAEVYQSLKITIGNKTVTLQHRPKPLAGYDQGRWQISGHTHNKTPLVDYDNKIINVSVENTGYAPISESEIIKLMNSKAPK